MSSSSCFESSRNFRRLYVWQVFFFSFIGFVSRELSPHFNVSVMESRLTISLFHIKSAFSPNCLHVLQFSGFPFPKIFHLSRFPQPYSAEAALEALGWCSSGSTTGCTSPAPGTRAGLRQSPPRAWISLICKISTLFQPRWKSITCTGKTVQTGKNGKEHFILCKPLICCDDPVRWWALSPSLAARYLQSQWMPPQTE